MEEPIDIIQLENDRFEWSKATFPNSTPLSSIKHLIKEAREIEQDILGGIKRPEEYADALMCLFDSAQRQKISVEEIFKAFKEKLVVNKNREWNINPDNSYSHV